jgi:hypothetical protein
VTPNKEVSTAPSALSPQVRGMKTVGGSDDMYFTGNPAVFDAAVFGRIAAPQKVGESGEALQTRGGGDEL